MYVYVYIYIPVSPNDRFFWIISQTTENFGHTAYTGKYGLSPKCACERYSHLFTPVPKSSARTAYSAAMFGALLTLEMFFVQFVPLCR